MIKYHDSTARTLRKRSAFGLVEVVISTLIVGIMLVAAMNTLGAFVRGQQRMAEQSRGWLLAQELASEILACLYEEPDGTPTFGRESGESTTNRAQYDDIDDYDGWSASPPEQRDGTPISELSGWERGATVEFVALNNPDQTIASDQGLKRIVISVLFRDELIATLITLRARAWQEPPFN
jgi:type II secretory pathway pseudopilin PulG